MPDAPDLLFALGAVRVIIAITGALGTHRFGPSHRLVFLLVGMLASVDGPLGPPFDDHGFALAVRALRRLAGLAQATMFLLLGLRVTPHEVWRERTPALWMAAGLMLLARPLAVAVCLKPLARRLELERQA